MNDFVGPQVIKFIHRKLTEFYYKQVSPLLIELPDETVAKCSYYSDALNQVVYHCCNFLNRAYDSDFNCTEENLLLMKSFLEADDQVSLKLIFNDLFFSRERIFENQKHLLNADLKLAKATCKNLGRKFQIDTDGIIPSNIFERMFEKSIKQWCMVYGDNVMYIIGAIAVSRHGIHKNTLDEFIDLVEGFELKLPLAGGFKMNFSTL